MLTKGNVSRAIKLIFDTLLHSSSKAQYTCVEAHVLLAHSIHSRAATCDSAEHSLITCALWSPCAAVLLRVEGLCMRVVAFPSFTIQQSEFTALIL